MVHRITFATKHNYNKNTLSRKKSGSNSLQKRKVLKVLQPKGSKYTNYNKKYHSPWIGLKSLFCNKTQLFSKCRHQSHTFDLLAVKNSLVNPIILLRIYNYFYNFQQSFTSNWPKTLWMAVDQRGVHLLEFRTRNVLNSFEYDSILDYTPSLNHMLLITGTDKKQSKIIVNTNQVCITYQSPFKI